MNLHIPQATRLMMVGSWNRFWIWVPDVQRELPANSGVGNDVCKTSVVFSTVILYSSRQNNKTAWNFPWIFQEHHHPNYQTHVFLLSCFDSRFSSTPSPKKSDFCRWMMKLPTSPTLRNADQPVHIYLVMRGWIPGKLISGGFIGCESLVSSWLAG